MAGYAGNIKAPSWYSGGLAGSAWPGQGSTFYLDGVNGLDANDGLTRATPKLTMTAALALCTNDADDYILVIDYWQPAGETWPIDVNKSKVHIIGVRSGSYRPWAACDSVGDTAVLDISANDVRVEGLYFDAGDTSGGIEFSGGVSRVGIYDCYFGTGAYGVYAAAGGCAFGIEVAGCYFQQTLTGQCIYINDDPAFTRIHDNVFDQAQDTAIEIVQGGNPQVYNNLIACGSDAQGTGIKLGAAVTRALVMNNTANFGDADMVANPFEDGAAGDINHWAGNMKGITLTHPA